MSLDLPLAVTLFTAFSDQLLGNRFAKFLWNVRKLFKPGRRHFRAFTCYIVRPSYMQGWSWEHDIPDTIPPSYPDCLNIALFVGPTALDFIPPSDVLGLVVGKVTEKERFHYDVVGGINVIGEPKLVMMLKTPPIERAKKLLEIIGSARSRMSVRYLATEDKRERLRIIRDELMELGRFTDVAILQITSLSEKSIEMNAVLVWWKKKLTVERI